MKQMTLWNDTIPYANEKDTFQPYIEHYMINSPSPVGAVLICPGGGYGSRADHEGGPVAEFYNSQGFHAFVIQYRVSPHRHPAPLADTLRAIRLIRSHAEDWNINADKIAVCGFSAGGHLTASTGVHYDLVKTKEDNLQNSISARPDALILSYPVITSGKFAHKGSFQNLLGEEMHKEMLNLMSLEKHVSDTTPPTFLWHTADDPGVPVENSMLFSNALSKFKIPFELHVFPKGRHGLGLAAEMPNVAVWAELSSTWLKNMGWG